MQSARQRQILNILIVPSRHLGWAGLERLLERQPGFAVVVAGPGPDLMIEAIGRADPDITIVAADLEHHTVIELVSYARRRWPNTRIVVLGEGLHREQLLMLARIGVDGCLCWESLTSDTTLPILQVLEAGIHVAAVAVGDGLLTTQDRRRIPLDIGLALTPLERDVLTRLASGATEDEVAERLQRASRTVRRTVNQLKDKLHASTLFVLGMRALELGFEPGEL